MRLILDIDQTLLHSVSRRRGEWERPTDAAPDGTIWPAAGDAYDLYLRPDIGLLRTRPFVIVSTGGPIYVRGVADFLARRGFPVERAYDVTHLPDPGGDPKPPITEEPALLIDDLAAEQAGASVKLAALPNGIHRRVDAWTANRVPVGGPRRAGESLRDFMARPRRTVLELVRSGDSRPFAECLAAAKS